MQRREFLRKGLALGAAGLLPNIGLSASESFPLADNEPLASMAMDTDEPIGERFRRVICASERLHDILVARGAKVEVIEAVKKISELFRRVMPCFERLQDILAAGGDEVEVIEAVEQITHQLKQSSKN